MIAAGAQVGSLTGLGCSIAVLGQTYHEESMIKELELTKNKNKIEKGRRAGQTTYMKHKTMMNRQMNKKPLKDAVPVNYAKLEGLDSIGGPSKATMVASQSRPKLQTVNKNQ